jgi:hypothetical protein
MKGMQEKNNYYPQGLCRKTKSIYPGHDSSKLAVAAL